MQKVNLNSYLTSYKKKINSKLITDLNEKTQNYNISRRKHRGKNLCNLDLSKELLDMIPEV